MHLPLVTHALRLVAQVGGYNLRFTELTNRNTEIDRCVRDGNEYLELLPKELRAEPPLLLPREVPDPDNEELGMELGGEGQMVWCQVGGTTGTWALGTVVGTRKRKVVVLVEKVEHDFDAKDLTQFEPSHARDLPNMVMMQNLHEAPLLYLLQRRLKEGRIYTWAGDVLISLNPYASLPSSPPRGAPSSPPWLDMWQVCAHPRAIQHHRLPAQATGPCQGHIDSGQGGGGRGGRGGRCV